ncbi:unnamed protein product [Allacma fusca]|uniref:F-box/LRR-repeat protein 15-like leucin rich repeat domain-containing protein n=1 Tax=Allacma fusca TaxID=39272 RepID=A0A8J2JD37_9HEXA|nr:unnamed protein product [Allacma fusca]
MSLSPSGMIDRASAEITRCIMRIKKKKDGNNHSTTGTPTASTNNSVKQTPQPQSNTERHETTNNVGTPQKKPMNNQMGLGNIIMMGTPTRKLNHISGNYTTNPSPRSKMNFSSNLMMDSQFLSFLFTKYFHGLDKLVLPLVCKYWRDTTYGLTREYWDKELVPVLNCKEIRHELLNCAGVRRRFYSAVHKRGCGHVKLILEPKVSNILGFTSCEWRGKYIKSGLNIEQRIINFCRFTGLKLLGATDEDAEDVLIHFSQGSSLIQTLKLYNSSLTDKGLYSLLDHLSIVENLELVSCNEITEDGITKALPVNLSNIVILDCIHVADLVFSSVAKLPCLRSFTIQAYHVTDAALSSFNSKLNLNLTTLKLNSCWELTNQAILHIVSSLPHLETLSLSGCSKVTDEGIEILAENLTVLKSLDLSWCSRITDSSLECIACDLVSLQQLILDRCTLVTDLGIGYLATMSSLRLLSIRWCSSIRDQAVHHIISIKKLQYLSIAGCTNISAGTLCSLSSLRELRELELTNCGVTPSVIQFLRNTLQHCLVIE